MNIEMVRKTYQLINIMEQKDSCFGQAERHLLLSFAFHQTDFNLVQRAAFDLALDRYELTNGSVRQEVLHKYSQQTDRAEGLPELVESYILEIEHLRFIRENANAMLEQILKQENLADKLDEVIAAEKRKLEEFQRESIRDNVHGHQIRKDTRR